MDTIIVELPEGISKDDLDVTQEEINQLFIEMLDLPTHTEPEDPNIAYRRAMKVIQ